MEKKWCVYILECLDGTYYTGITNDVDSRMKRHTSGKGSKYVKSRGFKEILCIKECLSYSDALKLELRVKSLKRDEKVEFLKSYVSE